jgi:hypothetical protein
MPYASHAENKLGVALGYTVTISPHSGTSYERWWDKGYRRVWSIESGWQTADVIDNTYCNHRKYGHDELEQALRRFLEEDDDA